MINELAGHVWWKRTTPDSYDVYLQTDRAVYRCSLAESAWREVDESPDPGTSVFSAPLEKRISRCLTASDGCRYVFFDDNTAICVFDPPPRPGKASLHSSGVSFVDRSDELFESGEETTETPVVTKRPKFRVKEVFEIPDRELFVMAGSIVEGEIQPGMFVHVPCNPSFDISFQIACIESARGQSGEEVHLCIKADSEEAELLGMLNIGGETLEVSTEDDE